MTTQDEWLKMRNLALSAITLCETLLEGSPKPAPHDTSVSNPHYRLAIIKRCWDEGDKRCEGERLQQEFINSLERKS